MTVLAFDWNPAKATTNAAKHGVSFDDASTVFSDVMSLSVTDPDSADEERWITLGETAGGRLVVVVHTWVEQDADRISIRIISARRPTRREARQYREGR